jgi:hypothetical protein
VGRPGAPARTPGTTHPGGRCPCRRPRKTPPARRCRWRGDVGTDKADALPTVLQAIDLIHTRTSACAAVYEYGCQVPSGIFSGGADRPRRRPRAASPSPRCSPPRQAFRLHPHAAGWAVGQGRKCSWSAGVRLGPGARNDRLSVGDQPQSPAPYTVYASSVRHAVRQGPPIERTVPSQEHPAAQRRPFPTSLPPPPRLLENIPTGYLMAVCERPAGFHRLSAWTRDATAGPKWPLMAPKRPR